MTSCRGDRLHLLDDSEFDQVTHIIYKDMEYPIINRAGFGKLSSQIKRIVNIQPGQWVAAEGSSVFEPYVPDREIVQKPKSSPPPELSVPPNLNMSMKHSKYTY